MGFGDAQKQRSRGEGPLPPPAAPIRRPFETNLLRDPPAIEMNFRDTSEALLTLRLRCSTQREQGGGSLRSLR